MAAYLNNITGPGTGVCSVLDNKETFVQFCASKQRKNTKDFITSLHRNYNLKLATMLDDSEYKDDAEVNKVVRRLRYCQSIAIVEKNNNQELKIKDTSKKCRHPLCQSCQASRANRMRKRLMNVFNSTEGIDYLENKKAYLITLTLRHNNEVRSKVYLDELKKYVRKLILSKIWKKYFNYTKKTGGAGWFINYEMTLTQNGFHIHSHILVIADTIKEKISKVQIEFQDKWEKLSGDSRGLRIDLAGKKKSKNSQLSSNSLIGEACEIFKYSVKGLSILKQGKGNIGKVVEWIKASKGKNMITAGGVFRGMGITSSVQKGGYKKEEQEASQDSIIDAYIGRTSNVIFNKSTRKYYSDKKVKKIIEDVKLVGVTNEFVNISDVYDEVRLLLQLGFEEKDLKKSLANWVEEIKEKAKKIEIIEIQEEVTERQLRLFAEAQKNNQNIFKTEMY